MPTHYQGKPEEVAALNTFIKINRACSALESRVVAHGHLGRLTLSQLGVLEALLHLGNMCQGELSRKLLTSTGNMTLVLDNLEKRSLIRRVRSLEDRRMVTIELTGDGRELIESIFPQHVAAIVAEVSMLSAEEQAELGRLCVKLGLGEAVKVGSATS